MVEKKRDRYQIVNKLKKKIYSRQKAPKVFSMNSSIYIWTRKTLFKHNSLFLEKTGVYLMPKTRSIDIDDKFSLSYVKYLMRNDK